MFVEVFDDKRDGAIRINDKKNNVYGYWFPPKLPVWALSENEKNHSSSVVNEQKRNLSNNQTSRQPQKKPQPSDKKSDFNRGTAVKVITEYLKNTGLAENSNWIMPLFKRINPNIKQTTITEVFEKASEDEFKKYYNVLRPVNDLTVIANHYKISLDDVLNYVQILNPTIKVDNLFSCFTHVTLDQVKEIVQFVKEDLKHGHIKQIA